MMPSSLLLTIAAVPFLLLAVDGVSTVLWEIVIDVVHTTLLLQLQ